MPRTKKVTVLERPTEVTAEVIAPAKVFSITATFKIRTKEGDRIIYKYSGKSADPLEALNLVCEDPEEDIGKPFPANTNLLINTTLKYGDYKFSRAIAPHVARDIFGGKNLKLFFHLMLSSELKEQLHAA